ncbi:MAG: hypothetical protein FWC95_01175 [Defluviitaleaceae bacterium]|nr:hypothetical protein [Defluviitaleaceae bacterium]
MDIVTLLSKPEFEGLSNERKSMLVDLAKKIANKTIMEAISIISEHFKNADEEPSPQERELMIKAYTETLSPMDKARFDMLLKMAGKRM